MEQTEGIKAAVEAEAAQEKASPKEAEQAVLSSAGLGPRKRGVFSRLVFFLLLLVLNALFVFVAVTFLLRNGQYLDSNVNDIRSTKVVEEESQTISVAAEASPAVVSIIATAEVPIYDNLYRDFFGFQLPSRQPGGTQEQQVSAGSGFLVSSDGYIITNKHVVDDPEAKYTVILNDAAHKGQKMDARVVAIDPNPNRDIAIVKIELAGLPYLGLGDSDQLKVGQTAIAIGYALGEFDNTVSKGVVSGLHRSITASGETLKNLIQTDAPVNSGNSGGPLLDSGGRVIGVNVAMADAQSIGFAIPINDVKTDYEQAKASGSIKKEAQAFLGVRYGMVDASVKKANNLSYDYGAIVVRGDKNTDLAVTPGSPADKAGIVENDIILEVNGERVSGDDPLGDLVGKYKPGDQLKLKVYHKGEEKEVMVTLSESQQ